jgi:hypothetical protein
MSAYFSFRSTVKDPESTALPCHCERNAFIHFSGKICDFEIHDLLAHTFLFMGAKLTVVYSQQIGWADHRSR